MTPDQKNVVLFLHERGHATAEEIGKRTGLNKQTVGDVLHELRLAGITTNSVRHGYLQLTLNGMRIAPKIKRGEPVTLQGANTSAPWSNGKTPPTADNGGSSPPGAVAGKRAPANGDQAIRRPGSERDDRQSAGHREAAPSSPALTNAPPLPAGADSGQAAEGCAVEWIGGVHIRVEPSEKVIGHTIVFSGHSSFPRDGEAKPEDARGKARTFDSSGGGEAKEADHARVASQSPRPSGDNDGGANPRTPLKSAKITQEETVTAQPRTQTREGSPPKQGTEPTRDSSATKQGGAVVACRAHNPEVDGSNPSPATPTSTRVVDPCEGIDGGRSEEKGPSTPVVEAATWREIMACILLPEDKAHYEECASLVEHFRLYTNDKPHPTFVWSCEYAGMPFGETVVTDERTRRVVGDRLSAMLRLTLREVREIVANVNPQAHELSRGYWGPSFDGPLPLRRDAPPPVTHAFLDDPLIVPIAGLPSPPHVAEVREQPANVRLDLEFHPTGSARHGVVIPGMPQCDPPKVVVDVLQVDRHNREPAHISTLVVESLKGIAERRESAAKRLTDDVVAIRRVIEIVGSADLDTTAT